MGLFNFKKKAKIEPQSADLPTQASLGSEADIPTPPSDFDLDVTAPKGSATENQDNFPSPPEMPDEQSFEMPSFPESPQDNTDFPLPRMGNGDMPFSPDSMPPFGEEPNTPAEQAPVPAPPEQAIKPRFVQPPEPVQKIQPAPKQTFQPEEELEHQGIEQKKVDFAKSLFIPIDEFKEAEKSMDVVKADIKKAEDNLERLSSIESERSIVLERVAKSADFVLKKLNTIDKKLFKKG